MQTLCKKVERPQQGRETGGWEGGTLEARLHRKHSRLHKSPMQNGSQRVQGGG